MSKVIIGCDPDSNKNGFAIYRNGVLCELLNLNSIQFYLWLVENEKQSIKNKSIELHIENPNGNNASSFNHIKGQPQAVKFKISESVGKVKQAQISVEHVAEVLGIPIVHHRNSSMWKKGNGKKLFESNTKWTGRSNEETRSAAYMAFMGLK